MKPRHARYGAYTEWTAVDDMVRDPARDTALGVRERYWWMPVETVDAFAGEAATLLARRHDVELERMEHAFIVAALRAKPDPAEPPLRPDWWAWLLLAALLALLLVTVVVYA